MFKNWFPAVATEHIMAESNLTSSFVKNIPMSQIDRDMSQRINARPYNGLNEDMARRYTGFMELGRPFVAIVLQKLPNGKYRILAGVHRFEAALRTGATVIDAHVVTAGTAVDIDNFVRSDNSQNALDSEALSEDQQLEQAIYMHTVNGLPLSDAVIRLFGTTDLVPKAKAMIRQQHIANKLKEGGANAAKVCKVLAESPEVLTKLYPLMTEDDSRNPTKASVNMQPLCEAFNAAVDNGLTDSQVEVMVKDVKSATTERTKLAAVELQVSKIKEDRIKPPINSDGKSFKMGLSMIYRTLCNRPKGKEITSFGDFEISTEKDVRELLGMMHAVCKEFKLLAKNWELSRKRRK